MKITDLIAQLQTLYFKHGEMPVAVEVTDPGQHPPGEWRDVTTVAQDTDAGWVGVVLQIAPRAVDQLTEVTQ